MRKSLFSKKVFDTTDPALGAIKVTPSDVDPLPQHIRAVTINEAGTISYVNLEGNLCETNILPVGSHLFFAKQIMETGTTAKEITGWV